MFPKQVVHLASADGSSLSDFRVGLGHLGYQIVRGGGPGVVFFPAQQVSQGHSGNFIMQARISPVTAFLPNFAIDACGLVVLTLGAEKVSIFDRKQDVVRILRLKAPQNLQGFVKATLAAQENNQDDFCVYAGFGVARGSFFQVLKAFLFTAAEAHHTGSGFHSPGKATDNVVVSADDQLGVQTVRIQFQNLLVIVPSANRVTQRRKPGVFDQSGVRGELGTSDSSGVDSFDVFGIGLQFLFFDSESFLD